MKTTAPKAAKRSPIPLVIGLVVAFLLARKYVFPSDEEKILQLLDRIVKEGALEGEEHPVASAIVAKGLSGYCTENAQIVAHLQDGEQLGIRGRKDIAQKIVAARMRFPRISLAYLDPEIEIRGDKAEVELTARALVTFPSGGGAGKPEDGLEEARVKLSLVEEDGEWLIQKAENVEPLEGVESGL